MSAAEDDLFESLTEGYRNSPDSARQLIDNFARELAETIRKQTARGNMIRPEFEQAWEQGLHVGADLIDPENREEQTT